MAAFEVVLATGAALTSAYYCGNACATGAGATGAGVGAAATGTAAVAWVYAAI